MDLYRKKYEAWCNDPAISVEDRAALLSLSDEKEIRECFYADLDFGTAGLRGIMGLGTGRMNRYTVARATLGLARHLKETRNAEKSAVAIAYDTRNQSDFFARITARVLTAEGFTVHLFDRAVPTPMLSFAVRELSCVAGVMITASHNPKEYNGYKVYDETGCQLQPEEAAKVTAQIAAIDDFSLLPQEGREEKLYVLGEDMIARYSKRILSQSVIADTEAKKALKVVYTSLHGTGCACIPAILKEDGFEDLAIVAEQAVQNGDFPTVKSPNPEEKDALLLGLRLAEETGADLVVGTDPDADRMGCAARKDGVITLLSGNQVGALLLDFLIRTIKDLDQNAVMINTVVSGELGGCLARGRGIRHEQVLTGFKYIGEKMTRYEAMKKAGDENAPQLLLGYEESYGYLVGDHARDKDAAVASMLLCEAAAFHKARGKTLHDALEELYDEFGYFLDVVESVTLPGAEGMEQIRGIMKTLRGTTPPLPDLAEVLDYQTGILDLPRANVLKFRLACGSWVAVRPSGTEPKIKFYYSVVAPTRAEAGEKKEALKKALYTLLSLPQ